MMRTKTFYTMIAMIMIINVVTGLANWFIRPEFAGRWFAGMVFMPLVWGFVLWSLKRRPLSQYADTERRFFIISVLSAGGIITLSLELRFIEYLTDMSITGIERAWGIGIGLLLVVMGNFIPKILSPISAKQCSGTQMQSTRRFAGWAFVIAGLIHTGLWVFAPVAQANSISKYVVMTIMALVILHYLWSLRRRQYV